MSLTKSSLVGIYQLFLTRESLVSDIPARDGKISNLFYSVVIQVALCFLPEQRPGTPADDHNNHQGEERVQIEPVQYTVGLNNTLKIVFTEVQYFDNAPVKRQGCVHEREVLTS
jgi:hypothetical protein